MHIDVHLHAKEDLDQLWDVDADAAAIVLTTLDQIAADPKLIDKLTQYGENRFGTARLNVKRWEKTRTPRFGDLWRFRVLDTAATGYRVIYGYNFQTRQICVLAVVKKSDFDYDDLSSATAARIVADWRSL